MPRTLKADDATEVALSSKGTVLPVDDETNFGPLSGKKKSVLAPEALAMDPRALAKKLAANAGRLPPTRTPTPRSRRLRRRSLEEDEPTQLGENSTGFSAGPTATEDTSPPKAAPRVDPRELARRLAAEAKQKIAREQAQSPGPEPAPPAEDPAALARRLAAEAKAKLEAQKGSPPPAPAEDPAALARRLAAEAKARLESQAQAHEPKGEAPAKKPVKPAPKEVQPELSAEPVQAEAAAPEEPDAPDEPVGAAPESKKSRSGLAARAPAPRAKNTTSAKDALQAALRRSSQPAPERQAAPSRELEVPAGPPPDSATVVAAPQPTVASPPRQAPRSAPERSAPPRAEPSVPPRQRPKKARSRPPTPTYLVALRELLPAAKIERERPVLKPVVFVALWEAHQARAVKDNQLELAASAALLLARVADRSPGDVIGIQLSHKRKSWAAFVDRTDGSVLAIVPDPAVYLAGLQ